MKYFVKDTKLEILLAIAVVVALFLIWIATAILTSA